VSKFPAKAAGNEKQRAASQTTRSAALSLSTLSSVLSPFIIMPRTLQTM
jgi:hypothetical protein